MLNALSLPELAFPSDFLWGTATAAHQVEGNDIHTANHLQEEKYREPAGMACDHWNRYQEDLDIMKELQYQAFRMSVSWGRVEPEEGRFDKEVLAHYQLELEALKNAGIKVFLTFLHGSTPIWFEQKGGFKVRENVKYFERYITKLVPLFKDCVFSFMVINEFNLSGGANLEETAKVHANYLLAHARGYHIIKSFTSSPVSSAHALQVPVPENSFDKFDIQSAELHDWIRNEFFFHGIRTGEAVSPLADGEEIPELKGAIDYWAVNYYCRLIVSGHKKAFPLPGISERLKMIDMDFYLENICPTGLRDGLLRLSDKPIYITENGISADDDRWRILKLAIDLTAIHEAMEKHVDVRGYLHWSFMDNYEWNSFVPRFGLIHVDFKTFQRTPKPSAHFYSELIRNHTLSGQLVRKYLPEMPVLKLYR